MNRSILMARGWATVSYTHLGEQKRVFSMIPGLEHAEFVRYGVMHRNTFLESPKVLTKQQFLADHPNVFFAGQIDVYKRQISPSRASRNSSKS